MRNKITTRTLDIIEDLRWLSAQLEPLLAFASVAARNEWDVLRARWPSDDDLREGPMVASNTELEWMRAKVLRFSEILRKIAGPIASREPNAIDLSDGREVPERKRESSRDIPGPATVGISSAE